VTLKIFIKYKLARRPQLSLSSTHTITMKCLSVCGQLLVCNKVGGATNRPLSKLIPSSSHRHRIHRPRKRPKIVEVVYQQLTQLSRTESAVGKPLIYCCENSSSYSGRGAWSIYPMSMVHQITNNKYKQAEAHIIHRSVTCWAAMDPEVNPYKKQRFVSDNKSLTIVAL